MIVVNKTKNTIYLEDIDEHVSYKDAVPETISPDKLKKSRCLRNAILTGMLEVVEYNENERIEKSIMYMLNKAKSIPQVAQKEIIEDDPEPPEIQTNDDKIEVKVHGLFYDASGYGKVNRNLVQGLVKGGFKVRVDPKRSQNQLNATEIKEFVALEKNKVSKNHILIDSIIPSFAELGTGKYKILYTTIESYSVPKQFLDSCQTYNEIWMTCNWSADVLRKELPDKPIHVVHSGVDTNLYTENGPSFDLRPNVKSFVFLTVFAWNYRKGPDVLMKAYFDEFSDEDDVSLIVMSRYQGGRSKHHKDKIKFDIDEYMSGFPNKSMPHVLRFGQQLPERDMPKLYRAADVFVLPTRGESMGLPPLEASMCGLPVIMTNCSGQQDYLRADNSYMIEIDHIQEAPPGLFNIHYWDGQKFPALTSNEVHQQLRKAMRSVYENYDEAKKRNKKMQKLILGNFTWNHNANAASKRLIEIAKKMR